MEIFKDLFPLEDRWGKDGVFTPTNIVKDMIDLLPDSIWSPESTFIDISCKTGAFLAEIYNRLDTELSKLDEYKDPVKRRSHILNNQLFGLALRNDESLFFSRRNVFGDPFSDNIDVINAGNSSYLDLVKQKQYSIIETQLKGKFGRMKFDVVVGNPPYNNDIYLDFVTLGHHLSTQYTLMITPAKWQAKTDGKPAGSKSPDKNVEFRKNIVPFMSKIVYYRDSTDIFDIKEWGGISYFLISKVINPYKMVKCICPKNKSLESDWEIHDEKEVVLIPRRLLKIIGLIGQLGEESFKQSKYVSNTDSGDVGLIGQLGEESFKQSKYVSNTDSGDVGLIGQLGFKLSTFVGQYDHGDVLRDSGYVEIMQGNTVCGYKSIKELFTTDRLDKYKAICCIMNGAVAKFDSKGKVLGIPKIVGIGPYQVPKGSFPVLKYFDTEEEVKSFVSLVNTQIIAFCYYLGTCGSTITREFFRFVPNPNDWTVTYVDEPHQGVVPDEKGYYEYNGVRYCSLYARYKLSADDISIIESIIKKRS